MLYANHLKKIMARIWFPKKNDSRNHLFVLLPLAVIAAIGVSFTHSIDPKYHGAILIVLVSFPLTLATILRVREIKTRWIHEDAIPWYLKESDNLPLRIKGIIGLLFPALSLARFVFPDATFFRGLDWMFLMGAVFMVSAYVAVPFFIIPAVIYIALYFVSGFFYRTLPLGLALLMASLLIQSISEAVQVRKIRQNSNRDE
ncbi:membrane hypothetical protein [Candidatus Desulfarcum epimagneticum]|uniref:Uncharacterized protein n=1 Tax=uncultured Desulfobacteraceae bacterium TaxID=218296 RepID=A0A484HK03_9BACT|nr:membrane hypothetical protein [uncultured Desulfobacteraceae bacterium]